MLTSRSNPLIIETASLKEKKYRDRASLFLVEGRKLFYEAVTSGAEVENVFCTEDKLGFVNEMLCGRLEPVTVSDDVMQKLSTEKAPEGIICTVKYIDKLHRINKIYNEENPETPGKRIILESLRDPGNLGTVIRTSVAFGFSEVILSSDCADIYNPRAVRASMGAIFRQKITVVEDLPASVGVLRENGFSVFAAMLDESAVRLNELETDEKTVFIIGNEGHGISEEVADAAGGRVFIPMEAGAESLNAAMAATVFMWQSYCSGRGPGKK